MKCIYNIMGYDEWSKNIYLYFFPYEKIKDPYMYLCRGVYSHGPIGTNIGFFNEYIVSKPDLENCIKNEIDELKKTGVKSLKYKLLETGTNLKNPRYGVPENHIWHKYNITGFVNVNSNANQRYKIFDDLDLVKNQKGA